LARQALTVQRRVHGDTHPEVLAARHTLAYALRAAGQYEQAAAHYRHVLEGERARYGPDHHTLAATHNDLAYLLKKQGHHASAVRHYREALAIRKRIFGPVHPKTTLVMQNLTGTLWAKEDYDAAEQVARQRLQVIRNHAPTDSSRLGSALGGLARLLADRGQFEAAIPPRRAVYRLYHEYLGATALYTIKQGGELGALLKAVGRDRAADSLLHRHHAYLEAQRDTILQQRDRYTRLDVVYSLRAMIRILEQSTSSTWARRYRTLLDDYTLEQSS
jgi:tetratricopeptide (TPR) repeat protein